MFGIFLSYQFHQFIFFNILFLFITYVFRFLILKTKLIENENGSEVKYEKRVGRIEAFCDLCAKLHNNLYISKFNQEREPLEISKFYNSYYDCNITDIF